MSKQFSLSSQQTGTIDQISLEGYLSDSGGDKLKKHVVASIDSGITSFIFDFTKTTLINSPGIASLLDVAGIIVDDFAGNLVTWGLDKHHRSVLEMSGFFFFATEAADQEEAYDVVQQD